MSSQTAYAISESTAYANTGTGTWTNPSDITGTSAYATLSVSSTNTTPSLDGYNFDPGVPGGATIDGFAISIEAYYATNPTKIAGCAGYIGGVSGTPTTTNSTGSDLTSTAASYAFGGSSDLWGVSSADWTVAACNGSTEGTDLTFSAWFENVIHTSAGTTHANAWQATVYYTTGGGGGNLLLLIGRGNGNMGGGMQDLCGLSSFFRCDYAPDFGDDDAGLRHCMRFKANSLGR